MKTLLIKIDTDILIIGGGPAGIQASRMLCASNPKPRVIVIRPEDHSMVYCAIPYAIEGLIPLEKTFKKDELVTDSGATLLRGSASSVDPIDHLATLADGRTISYGKLLVATGARPSKPPIKGVNAKNVFTVKTQEDAQRIISRLSPRAQCEAFDGSRGSSDNPQKAVVIGAGAIGIEQAMAYSANRLDVHLVEMQDHVLPHLVDADMTELLDTELAGMGIHIHKSTRLEALEGGEQVTKVRLSGGKIIPLDPDKDFVVIAVGMTPDIDFLDPSDFDRVTDGLVVDEHMKTNTQDVWAAGDCVSFYSGIDRKPLGGKLATNAVPMAKVAAKNMMGIPSTYPGFFNGAATVVGKYRIGGTGFTETFAASRGMAVYTSEAATTARFPMMPDAGYVKVKLVVEKGSQRLVGAQVIGTEAVAERIDLLTFTIQNKATVSTLGELCYSAQPWQTFFPARNAIVEAATIAVAKGQDD